MIGRLRGRVDYKAHDHFLLDVSGVGYLIFCSERTLSEIPGNGEFTTIYTDLLVREDLLQIFGFLSQVEKEWYRLLMSVQGVGAKASLAILSALGEDGVSRAIALGDWTSVKSAKGIGPKTAQRVVNELKDKAAHVMSLVPHKVGNQEEKVSDADIIERIDDNPSINLAISNNSAQADALSALQNLGYTPSDAAAAVAKILNQSSDLSTEELIRSSLKMLSPKG
ncbi:MAG: Holliday junction branch migration protein RuvA [Paracoccaceae bacterium]|jgi:Holliday junction DNA helicase RuvA|nr:Holliday junction branch migration protein RuvA [Paracoccaceae bacterium]MEC8759931.1 Holliday junction branch migration protein RuvA [Pseudomonadota bacterium]NCV48699.1 Holliday junction branch migration protein RuvA [Rhodobacterales bacterium]MDP6191316.1 Holliday junction branch migration protein RuvA [Paracoccaceae bacterium]NCW05972.1 Holliday junction branch migration protein RuvA [Rhodobacterales bacterium]|tara:strand:- start:362 stop:1033 length:672 start_codon:yes stop_codon:yes gene_type:complete